MPIDFEQFGGLTTRDIENSALALDLRNVRVDDPSLLVSRGGYDAKNLSSFSGPVGFARLDQFSQYVLVGTFGARAFDSSYNIVTDVAAAGLTGSATQLSDVLYLARATGVLAKWDGSAFAGVVGAPWCRLVCASSVDSRIVCAYSGLAGLNGARVHFSQPGSEVFGADDFLTIEPNDGQVIRGLVMWRDQIFVFKDRKFYIFNGTSVDATGGAIFNYRAVNVGVGCHVEGAAVAGRDGVYFMARDGVYRTTGDVPQLVSEPLQRLFDGDATPFFSGTLDIENVTMAATPNRIYLTDGAFVFHYDTRNGQWGVDAYPDEPVGILPFDDPRSFAFYDASGMVYEAGDSYVDDNGTSIPWYWQSGLSELGALDQEKVVSRSRVTGTGTVTLSRYRDFGSTDANAGALTLGSGTPATVTHSKSWRGLRMSHRLSGAAAASVSRVSHDVRTVRPVGLRSPA